MTNAGGTFVTMVMYFTLQMNNPSIQNDFSYYRRTMSRKRLVRSLLHLWRVPGAAHAKFLDVSFVHEVSVCLTHVK